QVQEADDKKNIFEDHVMITRALGGRQLKALPKIRLGQPKPFDDKWERVIPLANENIRQRLTLLTPYCARVDTFQYALVSGYLTQELGPTVVLDLLRKHPDLRDGDSPDVEKRMRIFRFCMQAGWIQEATKELDKIEKDFPDEKKRVT